MKENYEIHIEVRPSNIHGNGIFTNIFIPEGKEIMIINGEVIDEQECVRREDNNNVYIFWNGDTYIDSSNTEKIKYINHKCDFNCEVVDRDENSLMLVSYRDINAGEILGSLFSSFMIFSFKIFK